MVVASNNDLMTRSGHLFRPEEKLRTVSAQLRQGADVSLQGLPGAGKTTFVHQLISQSERERLELDTDYLMVVLDGQKFAHLSATSVWGAVVTALNRVHSGASVVCKDDDVREISSDDLREVSRDFKNHNLILILDNCNCASLSVKHERGLCDRLVHFVKGHRYRPTLLVIPSPPFGAQPCCPGMGDKFTPIDLTLTPEQAQSFLVRAVSQLGVESDIRTGLPDEPMDLVGENLYLLDCVCHWIIRMSEDPLDVLKLWLSEVWHSEGGKLSSRGDHLAEMASANHPRLDFRPILRRAAYEMCERDAKYLFERWWNILSEREKMVLLAIDELQRVACCMPREIEDLVRKRLLQRVNDRYLIYPRMFNRYVSRLPATCTAGPFRLDLRDMQGICVGDTRHRLSPEQACVFFRLLLHRDELVSYSRLYTDLYTPSLRTAVDGAYEQQLLRVAVDLELDELRRILNASEEIKRVSRDDGAVLRGYRLVVSEAIFDD